MKVRSMTNSTLKQLRYTLFASAFLALSAICVGGWVIDDTAISPYFGFRLVANWEVDLPPEIYAPSADRLLVSADNVAASIALWQSGRVAYRSSVSKNGYFGFSDIDSDGEFELLQAWAYKGRVQGPSSSLTNAPHIAYSFSRFSMFARVMKWDPERGKFISVDPTPSSKRWAFLVYLLYHSWDMVVILVMSVYVGNALLKRLEIPKGASRGIKEG